MASAASSRCAAAGGIEPARGTAEWGLSPGLPGLGPKLHTLADLFVGPCLVPSGSTGHARRPCQIQPAIKTCSAPSPDGLPSTPRIFHGRDLYRADIEFDASRPCWCSPASSRWTKTPDRHRHGAVPRWSELAPASPEFYQLRPPRPPKPGSWPAKCQTAHRLRKLHATAYRCCARQACSGPGRLYGCTRIWLIEHRRSILCSTCSPPALGSGPAGRGAVMNMDGWGALATGQQNHQLNDLSGAASWPTTSSATGARSRAAGRTT